MTEQPTIALRDGGAIPQLGFGVFQIPPGEPTRAAVAAALATGYRHVDTAAVYRNEADVGAAIRASGLRPGSVWVTTKLANADQGAATARPAFEASSTASAWTRSTSTSSTGRTSCGSSWRVLEQLHAEGLARSIGVSNFLAAISTSCSRTPPCPRVNQIELSPFLYRTREDTCAAARGRDAVEAYSPDQGPPAGRLDGDGTIAAELGRTPAQVLIRWSLQKGFIVPRARRTQAASSRTPPSSTSRSTTPRSPRWMPSTRA